MLIKSIRTTIAKTQKGDVEKWLIVDEASQMYDSWKAQWNANWAEGQTIEVKPEQIQSREYNGKTYKTIRALNSNNASNAQTVDAINRVFQKLESIESTLFAMANKQVQQKQEDNAPIPTAEGFQGEPEVGSHVEDVSVTNAPF